MVSKAVKAGQWTGQSTLYWIDGTSYEGGLSLFMEDK